MNEHDRKTLLSINKHIHSIQRYCSKCSAIDDFISDSMLVEACVFNLMQIGELSKTSLAMSAKNQLHQYPGISYMV